MGLVTIDDFQEVYFGDEDNVYLGEYSPEVARRAILEMIEWRQLYSRLNMSIRNEKKSSGE